MRFIVSTLWLLLCGTASCNAAVDDCYSQRVKAAIMENTFVKLKAAAAANWLTPNSGDREVINTMWRNWTALIVHIREYGYDSVNDKRNCSAEFEYSNVPPAAFLRLLPPSQACAKSFTYTIEPNADRSTINVSWRCLASSSLNTPSALNRAPKDDVLGFHIAMTMDELLDKIMIDKIDCARSHVDKGETVRCMLSNGEELLFNLTEHLNPNEVWNIVYLFQSSSSFQNQYESMIQQYRPQGNCIRNGELCRIEAGGIGPGLKISLRLLDKPTSKNNWMLLLLNDALAERDKEAFEQLKAEKQKETNPPKRF
jgi:hypothetical protein